MQEKIEDKGWWAIADSSREYLGKMSWDPLKGFRLLIDIPDPEAASYFRNLGSRRFPLRGRLHSMPAVRIDEATIVSIRSGLAHETEVVIHADAMAKSSAIIESINSVRLKSVQVGMSGLGVWINQDSISVSSQDGLTIAQCRQSWEKLFFQEERFSVYISQHSRTSSARFSFSAQSVALFRVSFVEPLAYSEAELILDELKAFLSLAMDSPVVYESIIGNHETDLKGHDDRSYPSEIQFFQRTDHAVLEAARSVSVTDRVPFRLSEVADPGLIYGRFCSIYRAHRVAMDFFFSQLYGQRHYPYQQFVDVVHALDGLDRAFDSEGFIPEERYMEEVYPKLIAAIPDEIGCDLSDSIKRRLTFSNRRSLRSRIKRLARKHAGYLAKYIGTARAFSDEVTKMRNKIAHPEGGYDAKEHSLVKYLVAMHKVRLLLQVELFIRIGVAPDFIEKRVALLKSASWCSRKDD